MTVALDVLIETRLDLVDTLQGLIPAPLQFVGHQPILGIRRVVLLLRPLRRIARRFQVSRPRLSARRPADARRLRSRPRRPRWRRVARHAGLLWPWRRLPPSRQTKCSADPRCPAPLDGRHSGAHCARRQCTRRSAGGRSVDSAADRPRAPAPASPRRRVPIPARSPPSPAGSVQTPPSSHSLHGHGESGRAIAHGVCAARPRAVRPGHSAASVRVFPYAYAPPYTGLLRMRYSMP